MVYYPTYKDYYNKFENISFLFKEIEDIVHTYEIPFLRYDDFQPLVDLFKNPLEFSAIMSVLSSQN